MIDADLPMLAADIAGLFSRYGHPMGARGEDVLPVLPAFIEQITANAEAADRWMAGGDAAHWHPGLDVPELPRLAPGPCGDPEFPGRPGPGPQETGQMAAAPARPGAAPGTYVLTISHRHGDDTTLHPSGDAARAALAGFARQWWHEITGPDGGGRATGGEPIPEVPPAEDDEAIRIYFD